MLPERYPPDDPREWLRLAKADLALANSGLSDVPPEPLCFHAQQAAEKALEAVMLSRAVPFPHIHDLGELIDWASGEIAA
ncbi:MAG: HEPN domain-containing protein [Gemmatimonadota bacterium]